MAERREKGDIHFRAPPRLAAIVDELATEGEKTRTQVLCDALRAYPPVAEKMRQGRAA